MSKITIEELNIWLSKRLGQKIDNSTIFFTELGMVEEEIEIFFWDFIDHFEIDPLGFNYQNYSIKIKNVLSLWNKKKKIMEFTSSHLLKVIEKGKWYDPEI